MISPILWKEWREQRWKLAFGTVMLVFLTGAFLAARLTSDREILVVILLIGGLVLSLYSAMGVFAPERSNGTTAFLAAKPTPASKVYFVKLFMGWLNFAVPMLACMLVMLVMMPQREVGAGGDGQPGFWHYFWSYLRFGYAMISLATIFYLLSCALAPRRGSEAAVGMTGLLIFGLMVVHVMIVETFVVMPNINKAYSLGHELIVFANPLLLLHLIKPFNERLHEAVMFIEQGVLLAGAYLIGLYKWRRSI